MEHQLRFSDNGLLTLPVRAKGAIVALWMLLLMLCAGSAPAQNPALSFVMGLGDAGVDQAKEIATDVGGNLYVSGYFTGTIDADPGVGVANLTSADTGDVFIAKYDNAGNYIWAFRIGGVGTGTGWLGNHGASMAIDGSGNVVVRGAFQGTADFDPGPGTFNMTATPGAPGKNDMFLARYSPTGNLLWAFKLPAQISSLAIDGSGGIVVSGSFSATVDFNPGTATTNLTAVGNYDMFVARYSATGSFVWAFRVGSTSSEIAHDVTLDNSGNIYCVGNFGGTVNFNPGKGAKANLTSKGLTDIFVAKYSAAGAYLWAFGVGSTGTDQGMRVATDGANIVVTGAYGGAADFNPGSGTAILTSETSQDVFVARYSSSGTYGWAIGMGDGWGTSIAIDGAGDINVVGNFRGTSDFDPGTGISNLTSAPAGDFNCFVARYSSSGDVLSAFGVPGTSSSHGWGLAIGSSGDIYVSGAFSGISDFDPSETAVNLTSAGGPDMFIARYTEVTQPKRTASQSLRTDPDIALHVAPNPFINGFTVSYDGTSAPSQIRIIDMMGRVVETGAPAGEGDELMLGTELPAGAYFVQIVQGDIRRNVLVHKVK